MAYLKRHYGQYVDVKGAGTEAQVDTQPNVKEVLLTHGFGDYLETPVSYEDRLEELLSRSINRLIVVLESPNPGERRAALDLVGRFKNTEFVDWKDEFPDPMTVEDESEVEQLFEDVISALDDRLAPMFMPRHWLAKRP